MAKIDFLKDLSNADSVAGVETEVRNVMLKHMKKDANKVYCDNIGSIIFEKVGSKKGPRIMLASHMDEIGFKVRAISDEGKIILKDIGYVQDFSKFLQAVRITTSDGKKIKGLLNSTYQKDQDIKKLPGTTYVELGLNSNKEAEKLGIKVGDMVTFDTHFTGLDKKGTYMGKSFDDRVGCYVLGRVLTKLKGKKHPNNLFFTGTSSEEVGVRGAKTASAKINPDVALIIDTTVYPDELIDSGVTKTKIGGGVNFVASDKGTEANPVLMDMVVKTAEKLGKQYQWDQFDGGATDAMNIQLNNDGVPTFAFCVPVRNIHGAYSIVNEQDIEDTADIIVDILQNLDAKTCKKFTKYI